MNKITSLRTVILFLCFLVISCGGGVNNGPEKLSDSTIATSGLSKATHPVPLTKGQQKEKFKEGEIIVKFKHGVAAADTRDVHSKHGATKIKEFRSIKAQQVKLKKGMTVEEAIKYYRGDPKVEYAEPNFVTNLFATPNDPLFSDLWGLQNPGGKGKNKIYGISAPNAWDITTGNPGVVVAVIDSGADYYHDDLAPNMWVNVSEYNGLPGVDDDGNGYVDDVHGIDTVNKDSDPMDDNNHGTHVAGTIGAAGNNAVGVVGVNWEVKIIPCKAFNSQGAGYHTDIIECIEYVTSLKSRGVNIIASNNSWGGSQFSQAMYDAIRAQSDILFVAAAGNDSVDTDSVPHYPASYDLLNIISVAAVDANENRAYFSNYGRRTVDVAAPGDSILSTISGNAYGYMSGTSMAAPHVTGLAALIKSQDMTGTWMDIKKLILTGGDSLPMFEGSTLTGKRVNAHGSLTCADSPLFSVLQYPHSVTINTPTTLSVLSINCLVSEGPVVVTTSGGENVWLADDGIGPDMAAGDGVFTATWLPEHETHSLIFSSPIGSEEIEVGYFEWVKTFETISSTSDIAVDKDNNIFVAGSYYNGIDTKFYLAKYDSDGNTLWTTTYYDPVLAKHYAIIAMTVDDLGNVIVSGYYMPESSEWTHILTIKYDSAGNIVWTNRYTGTDLSWSADIYPTDIAVDGDGSIYIALTLIRTWRKAIIKLDPDGNWMWSYELDVSGVFHFGRGLVFDRTNNRIYLKVHNQRELYNYVCALDTDGNVIWEKPLDGVLNPWYGDMVTDSIGNIYISGTDHHERVWTTKYDSSGTLLWSKYFKTFCSAGYFRTEIDESDNIYIAGTPCDDIHILKHDSNGNILWASFYDKKETEESIKGIALDSMGNVYVTGMTGPISVPSANLTLKYKQPLETQNQVPVADAGPDQIVMDDDMTGDEPVTLDGSLSNDPDGFIVSYRWEDNGVILGTSSMITPTLAVGTHNISLAVTDSDGLTATSFVRVTISEVTTNEVFVQTMDMSVGGKGKRMSVSVVVTIRDSSNTPVANAVVYGNWSGGVSQNVSGITSGGKRNKGEVTFILDSAVSGVTYTFIVTNVVSGGGMYNPASNVETSDSIIVP